MQISLTHTQSSSVCCADMTGLWSLRTVSCFNFEKHLICTHSVSLHHNHSLCSNLLLECMQVYSLSHIQTVSKALFTQTKNSLIPRMQTCMIFTHVHALPLVATVCVTSPTLNPCGNILNAQKYITLLWTGKRGKRLVTMFLKLVPGNHSMFTEASFLSLSSSSK